MTSGAWNDKDGIITSEGCDESIEESLSKLSAVSDGSRFAALLESVDAAPETPTEDLLPPELLFPPGDDRADDEGA